VRPWIFIFRDRVDAGRRLPKKLKAYQGRDDVMVLGLARGGAPVAFEVASNLGLPLAFLSCANSVCRNTTSWPWARSLPAGCGR
jgi:putative phosphoribosyl transferase